MVYHTRRAAKLSYMNLADLVRAVEEAIDEASSWDTPASLWIVHDLLEERLSALSVSFRTSLEGHPPHALELLYALWTLRASS